MTKDYSRKSDAQLRFIIKDAAEAALCMKDHDPVAEAKYLDQCNDACSELNKRKTVSRMAQTVQSLKDERDAAQAELFEALKARAPQPGTELHIGGQRYQVTGRQPVIRTIGGKVETGVYLSAHYWTTGRTWSRTTKSIWHKVDDSSTVEQEVLD